MDNCTTRGEVDEQIKLPIHQKKQPKLFPIFQKNFKPQEQSEFKTFSNEVQKTCKSRRKKMRISSRDPEGLTQSVLDAGQKKFGPNLCTDCGLLFSPGDAEDEKEHMKAHNRLENLHTVTLWKDVEILHIFPDGCYIVMISNLGPKKILNRFKDFFAWLDSELGLYSDSNEDKEQRIFFYVFPTKRKNLVRILGCLAVEILNEEVSVFPLNPSVESVTQSKPAVGIVRIWTDINFRKRQIATRLCDTSRFHVGIPNFVIPKENFGILEPSTVGQEFLFKYSNGKGFEYAYK